MKLKRFIGPLLGLVATGTVAQAAVLTFGYTTATTATSFAPPPGMETVAAFNFGSTATVDLGGVGFQGTTTTYTTVNGIQVAYSIPSVAWASTAGGMFGGNDVLNAASLTYNTGQPGNGANGRLEFSGLTVGSTYTFQFIAADGRGSGGNPPNLRKLEIVGAVGGNVEGTSDKFTYAYNDGQYGVVTATFTAENTNAWFHPRVYENNGTAIGTQINAVHIMVPEASSALLGGIGLLGLLRRRRK